MKRRIFNFHLYPESVTCPFCFNEIDRNRLLFRKSEGEKQYDVILREYLYSVKSPAEIKMLGKLINSEYYSERSCIIDKNRVSGVVDYDSEIVSNAVCPFCHNRISDFILDKPVKNIVLFSQGNQLAGNFFGKDQSGMLLVSRLRHSNSDIEFKRRIHIGENLIQYFAESLDRYDLIKNYIFTLWGNVPSDRDNFYINQMKKRSIEKADACVVYLNAESGSSTLISESSLSYILSICGGEDSCIRKPFAVCSDISSPDFLNELYNYFEKYKVFSVADKKLVSSENPVEWVFSNIRQ